MNTMILTEDGKNYNSFAKLAENRILFITDVIESNQAAQLVAAMLFLDANDSERKISLYINSAGGDIRSVFMIYDTMKAVRAPIETLCIGESKTESLILLAGGKLGMRYATQSSVFYLSDLDNRFSGVGGIAEAAIAFKEMNRDSDAYIKALASCTKKSVSKVRADCNKRLYLTSAEALEYGILDGIVNAKS